MKYVHLQQAATKFLRMKHFRLASFIKPEDHWSCIAHLIAEDMLKSAVIEEKMFKHIPGQGQTTH